MARRHVLYGAEGLEGLSMARRDLLWSEATLHMERSDPLWSEATPHLERSVSNHVTAVTITMGCVFVNRNTWLLAKAILFFSREHGRGHFFSWAWLCAKKPLVLAIRNYCSVSICPIASKRKKFQSRTLLLCAPTARCVVLCGTRAQWPRSSDAQ